MARFPGLSQSRRRRWAPKKKTGCFSCRSRHIRCDEQKPQCRNCITTDRTCPGYGIVPQTIHQPTLSPAPPGMEVTDQLYGQAFNMLRFETVCHVAGGFDDEFWSVDVLRAVRTYPAVWHAALSMAAMHTRLGMMATASSSPSNAATSSSIAEAKKELEQRYYVFALDQYNLAIKEVSKAMSDAPPQEGSAASPLVSVANQEMLLLVSVIFTGICTMQGDLHPALTHIKGALNLFHSWRFWERGSNLRNSYPGILQPRSLSTILTLFESHYENLASDTPLSAQRWTGVPPRCSSVPFRSITEAYFEYLPLQAFAQTHILLRGPPKVRARQVIIEACQVELARWSRKFNALKLTLDPAQSTLCGITTLLDLMELGLETFMSLASNEKSTKPKWASSEPSFKRLIEESERLFDHGQEAPADSGTSGSDKGSIDYAVYPGYRFCPTINEVLRFVAFFAFDLDVRRRAIALMRRRQRMDGLWHIALSANVAEAKIRFEEESEQDRERKSCDCVHCVYVCDQHRPESADEELPAEVTMLKMEKASLEDPPEPCVDTLPWVPAEHIDIEQAS